MPILEKEPCVFPDNLFDGFLDPVESSLVAPPLAAPQLAATQLAESQLTAPQIADEAGRQWWALFTRSRQEKSLSRHLRSQSVPFFLPLTAKNNRIRGRRVRSFVPLFPGYVFLFGTPEERVTSLKSNRISTVLPVADQAQLYRDLQQVYQLTQTNTPLTVTSRLGPGRKVRIASGAMKGVEGTVTTRRGETRLFIAVNFLETGVSVEIDDYMVEPID